MNALIALTLGTPIWGFVLQPPTATPAFEYAAQIRSAAVTTTIDGELPSAELFETGDDVRNDHLVNWTRALQVSTTVAMAVTGVLGFVQYHDEYGFHDEYAETACARGQGGAILDYCGESTPVPHFVAAGTTAVGLLSTVALSTQVDFDRAARRDNDWRIYETTRWVALGLGLMQALGGVFLANAARLDILDQETDFDTMHGFAVGHMVLGAANLALNVTNSILLF